MLNIYLAIAVAIASVIGLVFFVRFASRRHVVIRLAVLPVLAYVITTAIWSLRVFYTYSFTATVNGDDFVVIQNGRSHPGPILEVDVPTELMVGKVYSPWLRSLHTFGGYDYEWGMERGQPEKLVWETSSKCWIERYGGADNPRGIYIERTAPGEWSLKYVHRAQ